MNTEILDPLNKKKCWADPQLIIIDRNLISATKNNVVVRESTGHTFSANGYKYLSNSAHTKKTVLSKHGNPLQNLSSFLS